MYAHNSPGVSGIQKLLILYLTAGRATPTPGNMLGEIISNLDKQDLQEGPGGGAQSKSSTIRVYWNTPWEIDC